MSYPGCLIGIFLTVYYTPDIAGEYNLPLYSKQPVFFFTAHGLRRDPE